MRMNTDGVVLASWCWWWARQKTNVIFVCADTCVMSTLSRASLFSAAAYDSLSSPALERLTDRATVSSVGLAFIQSLDSSLHCTG